MTKRQREVLEFIDNYSKDHGFQPTIRELADGLGISTTNGVACHLKPLRKRGFVNWVDGQSRTLHITKDRRSWGRA